MRKNKTEVPMVPCDEVIEREGDTAIFSAELTQDTNIMFTPDKFLCPDSGFEMRVGGNFHQ